MSLESRVKPTKTFTFRVSAPVSVTISETWGIDPNELFSLLMEEMKESSLSLVSRSGISIQGFNLMITPGSGDVTLESIES